MKPTREQILQWAQAVGMERCDCEPRCHLHTGGMGSITALVDLAYEAGRKDENEACEQHLRDFSQTRMVPVKDTWRMGLVAGANAIRTRREQ